MSFVLRIFGQPLDGPSRAAIVRRVVALFGLALIATTWRLWTPQHVFPQVPLLGLAQHAPAWCDWLGAAGMVGGLIVALLWPAQRRASDAGLVVFAASTALMAVLDQGRLQPWAYQLALMAMVLVLAEPRWALALLRLFVVSFYFHSALSKFDYTFLHTLGQQFLAALAGVVGLSLDAWGDGTRLAAALVFPAAELAVAVGLCFKPTRIAALWCAVTLHVLLLVILGPFGLNHKPGVLVWNLFFIVQDLVLFAGGARWFGSTPPATDVPPAVPRRAVALVAAAVLLPFLAPTTWFDAWPAWALYAPSAERVTLLIHRRAVGELPERLLTYVEEPDDAGDPWQRVRLDRWALEARGAPIYPQNRYQLGVAREIVARYAPTHRARVIRFGMADRFSGERETELFSGLAQLATAADEYYLGSAGRQGMFRPEADFNRPPPATKTQ